MTARTLYRVSAPHFTAGFEVGSDTGRVERTAPILRRHLAGKTRGDALAICRERGWSVLERFARAEPATMAMPDARWT